MADHVDTQSVRLCDDAIERRTRRQQSNPQLPRPKVFQHRHHSADVVGVAMGDCNHVQPRDTAPPKIGRDDVLAEIELRGATTDWTSGIDEQDASLWRDQ